MRHQGSVGEQHDQDSSVSRDATRRDLWIFSVEKRISFLAAVTLEDEGSISHHTTQREFADFLCNKLLRFANLRLQDSTQRQRPSQFGQM